MDLRQLVTQLQGALQGERRIRGTVNSDGSVAGGKGFSVAKTGTGAYTITWDPVFADVPTFVVTPYGLGALSAKAGGVDATQATVAIYVSTSGANVNTPFGFVAVGP